MDRVFSLSKTKLLAFMLILVITPWLRGGKEVVAILIAYFVVLLGLILLRRMPDSSPLNLGMLAWVFASFLAWGGLSYVWSVNRFQTVAWLTPWIIGMGIFVVAYRLRSNFTELILNSYVLVAVLASLYGMMLLVTESFDRLTSAIYSANAFASYILPAIFITAGMFLANGKRRHGAALGILLTAMLLTYSRGGMLVLVASSILFLALLRPNKKSWIKIVFVVLAAVLLSNGISYLRTNYQSKGTASVPEVASTRTQTERYADIASGGSISVQDRLNYLKSGYEMVLDRPFTGMGAGAFATVYPQYQIRVLSSSTDPHNLYAQIFIEQGIVGGLLMVATVIIVLLGVTRSVQKNRQIMPLAIGLLALLIHAGLDIGASYPAVLWLGFLLTALSYKPEASAKNIKISPIIVIALIGVPVIGWYQSEALAQKGGYAQEIHDFELAANYFGDASKGLMYNPDTFNNEGINYYTMATIGIKPKVNLGLAQQKAQQAIKLDGQDAQHYFLLARALWGQGELALAEQNYVQALKLDPLNQPEYYVDLATLYFTLGRLHDATQSVQKVFALYPHDVVIHRGYDQSLPQELSAAHKLYAEILLKQSKLSEAIDSLNEALRLYPENAKAKKLLEQF